MKIIVDGLIGWSPKNVTDMVERAQLVVEAKVESVFPATLTLSAIHDFLALKAGTPAGFRLTTDAVLRVVRTFKGGTPATSIVLTQAGGQFGKCSHLFYPYQAFMSPGERYFLFVADGNSDGLPDRSGLPRYDEAMFHGLVPIEGDRLILGGGALGKLYENSTPEDFAAEIQASVRSHGQ